MDGATLKWLTGGDSLTGRDPYGKRMITFSPTHKLVLLTNHKPRIDGAEYAVWKRLHLVSFPLSFVDDPQKDFERVRDADLSEKLKAEAAGVIAWLVRGCLEWQEQGLNPPQVIRDATQEYQTEEDVIGLFIEEKCELGTKQEVKSQTLFSAYYKWCDENNLHAISQPTFGKRIQTMFERKRKTDGIVYIGIDLKPENSDTIPIDNTEFLGSNWMTWGWKTPEGIKPEESTGK